MTDVLIWKAQVSVIAYINISNLEILKMVLGLLLLLIYLCGCAGSLLLCGLFLVVVYGGYCLVAVLGFLTAVASPVAETSAWAQLLCGMWDLPRSGVEPVSPALAGGFFTTEPPGKPEALVSILMDPWGGGWEVIRSEIVKRWERTKAPSPFSCAAG